MALMTCCILISRQNTTIITWFAGEMYLLLLLQFGDERIIRQGDTSKHTGFVAVVVFFSNLIWVIASFEFAALVEVVASSFQTKQEIFSSLALPC